MQSQGYPDESRHYLLARTEQHSARDPATRVSDLQTAVMASLASLSAQSCMSSKVAQRPQQARGETLVALGCAEASGRAAEGWAQAVDACF